jgi:glyoxylase-like metal-dependent hydrolase (beta-lactamase superfamily II)
VFTPGHAAGHLAFYEPQYQLLLAGDMVSTITSIIIYPPEGDLTVYLASLKRLTALPTRLLLPAHGSASTRASFVLEEAIAHRVKREQQLLSALGPQPRTVADIALELYRGLPPRQMPLAEMQVLAGLYKLQREGRAMPVATAGEPAWQLQP